MVVWVLGEIYGWPHSGLVVPGYLAGVFAIQPEAGLVVVLEAICTYLLARFTIQVLSRFIAVDRAFGRDRFFLMLVFSVLVRLLFEGGPMDSLLQLAHIQVGTYIHSLGLVLVPLTANAFWKIGVLRGVPYVGLPVVAVFLLLKLVLLRHTNLSFSNFEMTYEDLALNFLASPHSYMVLLLGAFLATWLGVRFGWDSGGIIIPGLLAVSLIHPTKALATLGEVVVVVAILRLITAVRPLRTANLTGMRPLVLAFTVAYIVKLLISWFFAERLPGFRVADLFGFGYLLPSLIAVRCWRLGTFSRIMLPAALTAILAWGGANLASSLFEVLRPEADTQATSGHKTEGQAWEVVTELLLPPAPATTPEARDELGYALRSARRGVAWAGKLMQTDIFPEGAVLHSREKNLFGTAWIRPNAHRSLTVTVPEAATEPGIAEAGVAIAEALDAEILLLAPGAPLLRQARGSTQTILEIRTGPETRLSVTRKMPSEIDTIALAQVVPTPVADWDLDRASEVDVRFILSPDHLLQAALHRFDGLVYYGRPELYDPAGIPILSRKDHPEEESPTHLFALERGVIGPMLKARNGDFRWLRLASYQAGRMDLQIWEDETTLGLGPVPDRDPPRYSLWLRKSEDSSQIFEVRAGKRQYLTAEVARTWWAGTHGLAVLVHDAGADLDAEALRRVGPACDELVVLRALVRAAPGSNVVSVTAFREDEYPKADAVLSIGRPLAPSDLIPVFLAPIRRLVEGAGGTTAWYDGDPYRLRFYDPNNPRRAAVELAGGHYVTVYLSPQYRLRFASPTSSAALRSILADARIPLRSASVDEMLLSVVAFPKDEGEAIFSPTLEGLRRLTETGHPGELGRLRRLTVARNSVIWAFIDPEDGLPYIVEDRTEGRLVAPMGRGGAIMADGVAKAATLRIEGLAVALEPPLPSAAGGAP